MSTYRQTATTHTFRRLSLNSFWLLAARVGAQALAIVFTLLIARALGKEAFGSFAFVSAVVFIGNVLTTFGLDTLIIRETARERDSIDETVGETMAAALMVQLALSFLFILIVWLGAGRWVAQSPDEVVALRIAVISLAPLAFSTVYSAALRGYERMATYAVFSVFVAAVSAVGALLLYRRGGALVEAAWVMVIAQFGGAAVAFLLYRSRAPDRVKGSRLPSRRALRRVWRGGLSLAALMILAVLYQRLGVIMLSMLDTDAATGLYSAAARVMEALKMLPAAVFGALLPMMAAGRQSNNQSVHRLAVAGLVGFACILAALCALFARPIVLLLFGAEFDGAIWPLRVMSLSLPLTILTFALSFNLVIQTEERVAALALALTLAVSAILTGVLISRWSLIGAAVALPISEAGQVLFLWVLSLKAGLISTAD